MDLSYLVGLCVLLVYLGDVEALVFGGVDVVFV